jgi:cell division protein FtsI (penicillin-binding protein 3)
VRRRPVGRLAALFTVLVLALGGIFVRLSILQVSEAHQYRDLALNQRERTVTLTATRGEILDRSREALAMTLDARDIYADGRFVRDPLATAEKIAPLLHVKPHTLMPALSAPNSSFAWLARGVPMGVADRIAAFHLPGIEFLDSNRRFYPAGPLASQTLGFVGTDGTGLSGLELQYESILRGRNGRLTQEIDRNGQPIADSVTADVPPVPGQSVVTTIDRDLEFQVMSALQRAVETNRAKGGTVVVLDPKTGEILAMATYPWFDPNDFEAASQDSLRDRALTDMFEPGSVNKVITAAAAVQEHAVGLDQKIVVPYSLRVDSTYTVHDSHFHPTERMTIGDIIAQSSNIGTVKIAAEVGSDTFAGYLARFGFGQSTGLGFPGEASGILPPLFDWTSASMATIPYGQGIAVTPLQMASVYATIANGGTWIQPRLLRGIVDASGTYHPSPPPATREVVSPQTARTVTSMLAMAVQSGTGTAAQIPGYQVAGKTGTARIPLPDRPGYYQDRDVASFIGMLPASSPRVVIAAILDQPATQYGGIASAPLFQEIARYAIQRLGIQPGTHLPLPPHLMPVR